MNIGPLALSTGVLALLLGVIVGMATTGFMARRGHADAGNALYAALGVGLLLARVAYVIRWWPQYVAQPLSMLNVRDGGFDLVAGVLGVVLTCVLVGWRRPLLRASLGGGGMAGVATWAFVSLLAWQLSAAARQLLPDMQLVDVDGRSVSTQTLRGQPVVINFWATWCGPCRKEMPVLAEAQRTLPHVRFVFADQGESAATVRDFMRAEALTLDNVLLDEGMELSRYYRVRGYPTTVFIDADGHLRDIHMGELSRATLADRLRRIAPANAPTTRVTPAAPSPPR